MINSRGNSDQVARQSLLLALGERHDERLHKETHGHSISKEKSISDPCQLERGSSSQSSNQSSSNFLLTKTQRSTHIQTSHYKHGQVSKMEMETKILETKYRKVSKSRHKSQNIQYSIRKQNLKKNMSNIGEYGKKDRGINPKDLTKSTHI